MPLLNWWEFFFLSVGFHQRSETFEVFVLRNMLLGKKDTGKVNIDQLGARYELIFVHLFGDCAS